MGLEHMASPSTPFFWGEEVLFGQSSLAIFYISWELQKTHKDIITATRNQRRCSIISTCIEWITANTTYVIDMVKQFAP